MAPPPMRFKTSVEVLIIEQIKNRGTNPRFFRLIKM
nr:MAG TPA: hypothetical protein [Caudoviricetes sp.]